MNLLLFICFLLTSNALLNFTDHRGKLLRHKLKRFTHQTPPNRHSFKLPFSLQKHNKKTDKISAGSGAGMYGIAGPSYDNGLATLVKYDTITGKTTKIAEPTQNEVLTGESLGCLNVPANVFFFVYEAVNSSQELFTGLYPYDLEDPTKIYEPILLPLIFPDPFVGAGDQCTTDPNTGDIFVFGHDNTNLQYQLLLKVTFDAKDGSSTTSVLGNYSMIDDIPLLAGEATIYDSKRQYMWLVGEKGNDTNNFTIDYFYINAKTGDIEKTIEYQDVPLDTGEYNPTLDAIVGIKTGKDENGFFKFALTHLDPVTLEVTKRFEQFGEYFCSWEAIYSQDTKDNVYYQLLYTLPDNSSCDNFNGTFLGHLTGVFAENGTVRAQPPFCLFGTELTCPWELQYYNGP